jgi:hypothetical protein
LTAYNREKWVGWQGAFAGKPSSYSLIECIRERLVVWQDAFAGKPAPTVLTEYEQEEIGRLAGRFRRQASSHSFDRVQPEE